jgi:hypothetical protein
MPNTFLFSRARVFEVLYTANGASIACLVSSVVNADVG